MKVSSFVDLDKAFDIAIKEITADNKEMKLKQLKEKVLTVLVEVEEQSEQEYDDLLKLL
jgi:hypothetical protein